MKQQIVTAMWELLYKFCMPSRYSVMPPSNPISPKKSTGSFVIIQKLKLIKCHMYTKLSKTKHDPVLLSLVNDFNEEKFCPIVCEGNAS